MIFMILHTLEELIILKQRSPRTLCHSAKNKLK